MSLVKNKKVITYLKSKEFKTKKDCTCSTDLAVKRCRENCTNNSFHKINYNG